MFSKFSVPSSFTEIDNYTNIINHLRHSNVHVVTVQGLTGSWYSRRRKIFTEPLGCLACLYSQVGEPRMLQAMCPPACLCVAHAMALTP